VEFESSLLVFQFSDLAFPWRVQLLPEVSMEIPSVDVGMFRTPISNGEISPSFLYCTLDPLIGATPWVPSIHWESVCIEEGLD
jgi:hypothetical protein